MQQISLFDGDNPLKIDKPIRLIQLFAGYGSQALALKYLGVPYEDYKISEWAVKSIQAYKDLHFGEDNTDYSKGITKDEITAYLCDRGISADYNQPMTYEQIKRLSEDKQRQIYNNIIATHNLVSVCNAKGKDFEITDTDKYCYIMTYSFPCQDLSSAGLGKGMGRDSGTRSGLLWEVERILKELHADNKPLPQVLLMENVPEVIGKKNIKHFADWVAVLDKLGYKSKWQLLNGKDFVIPQNRNRCFMVSILGDYYYEFPQPKPLKLRLKDMLEDNVDEKYYLSNKTIDMFVKHTEKKQAEVKVMEEPIIYDDYNGRIKADQSVIGTLTTNCGNDAERNGVKIIEPTYELSPQMKRYIVAGDDKYKVSENNLKLNRDIACAKTTREGSTRADTSDYISPDKEDNCQLKMGEDLTQYRIRKLTPKECGRLMGVKDEDIDKIATNQSNSSQYHLYGDSIIVDVLMSIFKKML